MAGFLVTQLNDEQYSQFKRAVAIKRCPICGGETLEHSRTVTTVAHPPLLRPEWVPREARLTVVCASCGYIMEFRAATLGIR